MSTRRQLTAAESLELATRLRDAINTENRIFEAVGDPPLAGDELKALTRDVLARFGREHGVAGGVFSETFSGPSTSLTEMAPADRERAVRETADRLLPTLPAFSRGSPTGSTSKPLHEMTPAERRAYVDEAGHRLLPGNEYGRPRPGGR